MKKIIFIVLIILFNQASIMAQCISLYGGNNLYCYPATYSTVSSGTIYGLAAGIYRYELSRSGSFTTTNLQFGLNGLGWAEGSLAYMSNGSNNFSCSGYLPPGVSCGQSEQITFKIFNLYGQLVCENTISFVKINQTISGTSTLCANTTGTYKLNDPGNLIGGTYTWTTTNGWLINGSSSPLTTSSKTVSLTAQGVGSSTTLCVTSSTLCQSQCFNVSANTSQAPTETPYIDHVDGDELWNYYYFSLPSGATSLQRSSNNSTWSAFSNPIKVKWNSLNVYIRGVNACGAGASEYFTLYPPASFTLNAEQRLAIDDENIDLKETQLNVFPNPTSENLTIQINSVTKSKYTLALVDVLGKTVVSMEKLLEIGLNQSDINVSNLNDGIYFLNINNGSEIRKEKIVINH